MDKKNKSFSAYFTEPDAQQVRAAFLAAGHLEGYTSITEFIEAAIMRELRRLQRNTTPARNGRASRPERCVPAAGPAKKSASRTRSASR